MPFIGDELDDEDTMEGVTDDDLLMAIATIDGEDWIVYGETPRELGDTIVAMVTAA